MTDTDWQWGMSNAGSHQLLVWLEPWAEEFEVAPGSTVTLGFSDGLGDNSTNEIESTADRIIIWAGPGQTVGVAIDCALQQSGSASIPVPGSFEGSTKKLLGIMFGGEPFARLGGIDSEPLELSWWQRAKRHLDW